MKPRDSPAAWGTDNEAKMRQPDDPFFKKFAAECSRVQIAVDIFSFWCGPACVASRVHPMLLHIASCSGRWWACRSRA